MCAFERGYCIRRWVPRRATAKGPDWALPAVVSARCASERTAIPPLRGGRERTARALQHRRARQQRPEGPRGQRPAQFSRAPVKLDAGVLRRAGRRRASLRYNCAEMRPAYLFWGVLQKGKSPQTAPGPRLFLSSNRRSRRPAAPESGSYTAPTIGAHVRAFMIAQVDLLTTK